MQGSKEPKQESASGLGKGCIKELETAKEQQGRVKPTETSWTSLPPRTQGAHSYFQPLSVLFICPSLIGVLPVPSCHATCSGESCQRALVHRASLLAHGTPSSSAL